MRKEVTFFGGAMNITDTPEYLDSIKIGEILAEKGYLVKNGGYRGLMEAVSKGVSEKGGHVIGYTCKTFPSIIGNHYLTLNVPENDIYDRLRSLITDSSLFIIQKGGIGTLAELFLTLDILRKEKYRQPKVILFGEFWLNIMESVKPMMNTNEQKLFVVVKNIEEFKKIV